MSHCDDELELRTMLIAADRRSPEPEVRVVVDTQRFERVAHLRLIRRVTVLGMLLAAITTWNILGREATRGPLPEVPLVGAVEGLEPRAVPHPDDLLSHVRLERAAMTALVGARQAAGERRERELRSVVQLFDGTEAAEWASWSLRFLSSEEK